MQAPIVRAALLIALTAAASLAQDVILLPFTPTGPAPAESYPEKQYFSNAWNTEVVSNVTKPTLTVYKPLPWMANGAAVVICPGGGFMALSINSEGIDVAQWLAAKGITAFVLKYRLAHTGEDATTEFQQLWQDKPKFSKLLAATVPLSIEDGLLALTYVRQHAAEWKVSPDKVGIVGFSAGGTVAAAVALRYKPAGRPAFVAPIYGAVSMLKDAVPPDAPPLFVAAATDDNLGLAGDSVALYERWTAAHKSAELHMYARGRHGFGMRKQDLPSDEWIARFWDWLQMKGVLNN